LIVSESVEDREAFEANFRAVIFANDQHLYYEMFEKDNHESRQEIEDEIEWIIPESPEELEELMRGLPIPD
jgi:hypothetical protein